MYNWSPDYTKFPPYIPTGRYMIDFKFTHLSAEVNGLQQLKVHAGFKIKKQKQVLSKKLL